MTRGERSRENYGMQGEPAAGVLLLGATSSVTSAFTAPRSIVRMVPARVLRALIFMGVSNRLRWLEPSAALPPAQGKLALQQIDNL